MPNLNVFKKVKLGPTGELLKSSQGECVIVSSVVGVWRSTKS